MARLSRRQLRAYRIIVDQEQPPPACDVFMYCAPGLLGAAAGAWVFAREYGRKEGVDLKRLQAIVIKSKSPLYAYKFARDVPGVNVRRLQDVVIKYGSVHQMRVFAMNIPTANKPKLE